MKNPAEFLQRDFPRKEKENIRVLVVSRAGVEPAIPPASKWRLPILTYHDILKRVMEWLVPSVECQDGIEPSYRLSQVACHAYPTHLILSREFSIFMESHDFTYTRLRVGERLVASSLSWYLYYIILLGVCQPPIFNPSLERSQSIPRHLRR